MKHQSDARSLVMMPYNKIEPMIWERFQKAGYSIKILDISNIFCRFKAVSNAIDQVIESFRASFGNLADFEFSDSAIERRQLMAPDVCSSFSDDTCGLRRPPLRLSH